MERAIEELQDNGRRAGHLEDRGHRPARGLRGDLGDHAPPTDATASRAWSWAAEPTTPRSTTGCATGAGVPGYIGFAIGRSIWWEPLKAFVDGTLGREEAAKQIAANYRRFIDVYNGG